MASLKQIFIPVIGAALSLGIANKTLAQNTDNSNKAVYAKNDIKPEVANTNSRTAEFNDTTKVVAENPLVPAIREGGFGDALWHSSQNNLMVIEIAGPSAAQLKKEAQTIHNGFKNAVIPTDVVVFYHLNNKLSKIMGSIAMNGHAFKLPKSGTEAFDAETIKKYTDTLVKYYNKNYGQATASNTTSTNSEQTVAYEP